MFDEEASAQKKLANVLFRIMLRFRRSSEENIPSNVVWISTCLGKLVEEDSCTIGGSSEEFSEFAGGVGAGRVVHKERLGELFS